MSSPVDPADPITQLGELLATADHHVQQIVAAAERRAEERLRQAQLRIDARTMELNAIAEQLLSASAVVEHQLDRLRTLPALETSDEAAEELRGDPDRDPVIPPAVTPPAESASNPRPPAPGPLPTTVPVRANVPAHDHDLPIIDSSETYDDAPPAADLIDSARLVALSMAASGRTRGEVEAHLRNELGISDYGPLIDYVFGISTPASVVPSWPPRRRRRG